MEERVKEERMSKVEGRCREGLPVLRAVALPQRLSSTPFLRATQRTLSDRLEKRASSLKRVPKGIASRFEEKKKVPDGRKKSILDWMRRTSMCPSVFVLLDARRIHFKQHRYIPRSFSKFHCFIFQNVTRVAANLI